MHVLRHNCLRKHLYNIRDTTKAELCVLSQLASFAEYQSQNAPVNACSKAHLFEKHLNNIRGTAKAKLCVLSQLASFIEYQPQNTPINACSEAQFNCFLLVWGLHSLIRLIRR